LLSALDDVKNMTSKDIEKAIKDNFPSLNKKGSSPDGRFIEYVDSKGRTRIKIHPADPQTLHSHMHIYDSKGNPLDKNLKTGSRRSSDVHIQILEP
jgi:hypothetical protein